MGSTMTLCSSEKSQLRRKIRAYMAKEYIDDVEAIKLRDFVFSLIDGL